LYCPFIYKGKILNHSATFSFKMIKKLLPLVSIINMVYGKFDCIYPHFVDRFHLDHIHLDCILIGCTFTQSDCVA